MTKSRSCGDCILCCTVMSVPDMDPPKQAGIRCSKVCTKGCRIYNDRPNSCKEFECVWLQGHLPQHWRPDKIRIVFATSPNGEQLFGYVDPKQPEAWRKIEKELQELAKRGLPSVLGYAGKPLWKITSKGTIERSKEISKETI